MNKNSSSFESWLEKIRYAHPAVQRFWLYTLSGVTMAVVVALWSGYMSLEMPSIAPVNQKLVAKGGAATLAARPQENLDFGSGLALLTRAFGVGVSRSVAYAKDVLKNKIMGSEETIISKPRRVNDFAVENLPKLPAQKLPIAE